jgi:hypothetical protein
MDRSTMVRVKSVRPLEGFNLDVEFTDGTQRVVDVDRYLRGPVFEPIRRHRVTGAPREGRYPSSCASPMRIPSSPRM